MTRFMIVIAGFTLALAASGCGDQGGTPGESQGAVVAPSDTSPISDGRVMQAVVIAREIQARPDDAVAILKEHGITREAFESLLYEIAASPDLSRAYNAEMGN